MARPTRSSLRSSVLGSLLALASAAGPAAAEVEVFVVDHGATPGACGDDVPCTLDDAVDQCNALDPATECWVLISGPADGSAFRVERSLRFERKSAVIGIGAEFPPVLNGDESEPVIDVPPGVELYLTHVQITDGKGAIRVGVGATADLVDVELNENFGVGAQAALEVNGGEVRAAELRVIENEGLAGAVYLAGGGSFSCKRCEFAYNTSMGPASIFAADSTLLLTSSKIHHNRGGVFGSGASFVELRNVAMWANQGSAGPPSTFYVTGGETILNNATVVNDSVAPGVPGGVTYFGGGPHTIDSSIVTSTGLACAAAGDIPLTVRYSLVKNNGCPTAVGPTNQIDVDPMLVGDAASDGLPTLDPKSPAVDLGSPQDGEVPCEMVDLRGVKRPHGEECDSGAVESTECQDEFDNDGDFGIDFDEGVSGFDPECDSINDTERPACSNRLDDDSDGAADLADPGCDQDPSRDSERRAGEPEPCGGCGVGSELVLLGVFAHWQLRRRRLRRGPQ